MENLLQPEEVQTANTEKWVNPDGIEFRIVPKGDPMIEAFKELGWTKAKK